MLGTLWTLHFLQAGRTYLALVHVFMVASGIGTLLIARLASVRSAAVFALLAAIVQVTLSCLFDPHLDRIPASTYHFFLPLGAACLFLLRPINRHLCLGACSLCLLLFFLFGTFPLAFTAPELVTPAQDRPFALIANNALATMLLGVTLFVMLASFAKRNGMEADLRRAIFNNKLELHYQPQVCASGEIVEAEALVRWNHPRRGRITPADFIPLAEETGLIVPLGLWALRTACIRLARTSGAGDQISLAVNVSAHQIDQADFAEQVEQLLRFYDIPPGRRKLEITETALSRNGEAARATMLRLQRSGIVWSLDDFGTGYASLSLLSSLPFSQIKIDRSFVSNLSADPKSQGMVSSIIDMGERLACDVIAEGVETYEQRDALVRKGCRTLQGYLFGKPMSGSSLDELIDAQRESLGSAAAADAGRRADHNALRMGPF